MAPGVQISGSGSRSVQSHTPEEPLSKAVSVSGRANSTTFEAPALADDCRAWLQQRLRLLCPGQGSALRGDAEDAASFVAELYDSLQHGAAFQAFLVGVQPCLFAYITPDRALALAPRAPRPGAHAVLLYILKPQGYAEATWTAASLTQHMQVRAAVLPGVGDQLKVRGSGCSNSAVLCLQVGVVKDRDPVDTLERLMQRVLAPIVLSNTTWPDTIRKDLVTSTHRFLSSLVQCVNAKKGNTVLYLPDLRVPAGAPAPGGMQKGDALQLMESCVIHSTRQVKDVLNRQDNAAQGGSSGPLDEIEFWRDRSRDLGNIRDQLDSPECQYIVQVRCTLLRDTAVPVYLLNCSTACACGTGHAQACALRRTSVAQATCSSVYL